MALLELALILLAAAPVAFAAALLLRSAPAMFAAYADRSGQRWPRGVQEDDPEGRWASRRPLDGGPPPPAPHGPVTTLERLRPRIRPAPRPRA
jgi:hypothetical protein